MDKRRIILNVSISILSKVILLIVSLIVRRLLIRYIGNDINGLNSLFTSIVGMLSVAELGVGSAIVFSMYSPIVAGEQCKIAALYCLYKKLYRIIGGVIFVAGLAVMPFLPKLISDYDNLNINGRRKYLLPWSNNSSFSWKHHRNPSQGLQNSSHRLYRTISLLRFVLVKFRWMYTVEPAPKW